MRDEPAPVDRIGAAELDVGVFQIRANFFVAENIFDAVLAVVEIAAHGGHVDIAAGLRNHLEFLNHADAVVRIKDHDFSLRNVGETSERGFAGIARSRYEYQNFFRLAGFFERLAHELRQNLER